MLDEYEGNKFWKVSFYPKDADELQKIKDTGLKLKIREDDGGKFVIFKRPETKQFKTDLVTFEAPKVINPDGSEFDAEAQGQIGNGTKATVKVEIFDAGQRKGHRLEMVRIDELVKYEKPEAENKDSEYKAEEKKGLPF